MTAIALVAHHERTAARHHVQHVADWCNDRSITCWMPADDGHALDLHELVAERPLADADLVVSLGGDGTMLRSVRLLGGAPVPVLGLNLGSLGYLTELEPERVDDALERFLRGPADGGCAT